MSPFLRATTIWANLIATVFLISLGSYVYTHDDPYLSYQDQPFETLVSAVRVGHTIPLKVTRCNADTETHVYTIGRWLIDDDHPDADPIILNGGAVPIKPGCTHEISEANQIPSNTALSHYHLEGVAEIHTRFHSYLVKWSSQSFQVVANDVPTP